MKIISFEELRDDAKQTYLGRCQTEVRDLSSKESQMILSDDFTTRTISVDVKRGILTTVKIQPNDKDVLTACRNVKISCEFKTLNLNAGTNYFESMDSELFPYFCQEYGLSENATPLSLFANGFILLPLAQTTLEFISEETGIATITYEEYIVKGNPGTFSIPCAYMKENANLIGLRSNIYYMVVRGQLDELKMSLGNISQAILPVSVKTENYSIFKFADLLDEKKSLNPVLIDFNNVGIAYIIRDNILVCMNDMMTYKYAD